MDELRGEIDVLRLQLAAQSQSSREVNDLLVQQREETAQRARARCSSRRSSRRLIRSSGSALPPA
jgi:hypothetical protein